VILCMPPPSYDTQATECTHMVYAPQPLRVYTTFVLRRGGKRDSRKDSILSTLSAVFYWNVAPKPLSTAIHESS
jgi:hypothetical protein